MAATTQQLNAVSTELQNLSALVKLLYDLKRLRAALAATGADSLAAGDFPLAGDLDHLTRPLLRQAVAGIDLLVTAFETSATLDGVTVIPRDAILRALRSPA